jgi:hypothetical protein
MFANARHRSASVARQPRSVRGPREKPGALHRRRPFAQMGANLSKRRHEAPSGDFRPPLRDARRLGLAIRDVRAGGNARGRAQRRPTRRSAETVEVRLLAVADLGPHATLLAADLAAPLARLLRSHVCRLSERTRVEWIR